ncbi:MULTISPECIES: YgzB family protein [Bacillus cereus group]|uniref:YgzB family protein n=1 Tax=Bacillus cereus group TaxID=86661 RepID=UPI001F59FFF0|nr:YgzB family protein [Bacillus cereus group sp. BfR-BA-01522]
MGIKYSNKINKIRTFALSLVFIGLLIAYLGVFFRENIIIMTTFMMLGFLAVLASTFVYFWIGMLSTKTVQIVCPSCNKPTKMLGRVDVCMHCNQPLTLDPNLEGKEFDEKYNKKL